jgi:hypothetical protein
MTSSTFTSNIDNHRSVISCDHHFFNIQRLCDEAATESQTIRADARYRILFVTRGDCKYLLDRKMLSIDSLKIGIVKPKHGFSLTPRNDTNGYVISFSMIFFKCRRGPLRFSNPYFLILAR